MENSNENLSERFRGAEIHVVPVELVAPPEYMDTCYAVLSWMSVTVPTDFALTSIGVIRACAFRLAWVLGTLSGGRGSGCLVAYGPEGKPSSR